MKFKRFHSREETDDWQDGPIEDHREATSFGLFMRDLEPFDRLSLRDEQALFEEMRKPGEAGAQARDEIVCSHVPLVIAMAKRLYEKYARHVAFDELVSAGTEGLVRSLKTFDRDLGYRFSTYARHHIQQRMLMEVRSATWRIHIPDGVFRDVSKFRRAMALIFLNDRTDDFPRRLQELKEVCRKYPYYLSDRSISEVVDWSFERADAVDRALRSDLLSLDSTVGEEGLSSLHGLIPDSRNTPIEEEPLLEGSFVDREVHSIVRLMREHLDERQFRVLELRYGLADGIDRSQQQVARAIGLSRQRVQQIECHAIERLRSAAYSELW